MSATTESEIKASLQSLLGAIKGSDATVIAEEMACLDEITRRRQESLHPQLVHFLQRRSYAKALMFLGGETEIPTGACGSRGN